MDNSSTWGLIHFLVKWTPPEDVLSKYATINLPLGVYEPPPHIFFPLIW